MWNGKPRKLRFSRHGDWLHVQLQALDIRMPQVNGRLPNTSRTQNMFLVSDRRVKMLNATPWVIL